MKTCFLVLVHNDPIVLKRLVTALDYPNFDIYVHVDKKVDISIYKFNEYKLQSSRLFVMPKRRKVYWGDISIVEATLDMYRYAYNMDCYDRFVTLSGNDYPILSNRRLHELFSDLSVEYIMGNKLIEQEYFKVKRYFFFKHSKVIRVLLRKFMDTLGRKKNEWLEYGDKKIPVYFGPQWHALTRNFVTYMLGELETYPEIMNYFKFSFAPDELLIPTLIFNSVFSANTLKAEFDDNIHYNLKNATHFLNYDPLIEVFTEKRFEDIVSSDKMFLRKVRTGTSDKLLDKLDEWREKI